MLFFYFLFKLLSAKQQRPRKTYKPNGYNFMTMQWHNERVILANPDILSERYAAEEIHAREAQLKEIRTCLRPITEGKKPMNAWLHGKPGAGKTATARWILKKLESEAANGAIETYQNKCEKIPEV